MMEKRFSLSFTGDTLSMLLPPNAFRRDYGNIIGLLKFRDILNSIHSAQYAIDKAREVSNEARNLELFYLTSAILDYNACYDYVNQIVFFCFNFGEEIKSKKNLEKQVRSVKSFFGEITRNKLSYKRDSLIATNAIANTFFEKLEKFFNNRTKLSRWANCIKHHGGFATKELLDQYDIASIETSGGFSLSWAYQECPERQVVYDVLLTQNNIIVEYVNGLFIYIFKGSNVIGGKYEKPFVYQQISYPNDNVFITKLNTQEI